MCISHLFYFFTTIVSSDIHITLRNVSFTTVNVKFFVGTEHFASIFLHLKSCSDIFDGLHLGSFWVQFCGVLATIKISYL